MIGQTISHYRIEEKIGEGGMGEVYLAQDLELNRRVAIKFLPGRFGSDRDMLVRFKREAQAAASLDHPNIITIHEVGEHAGRPYMVMAYVPGEPLSAAAARGPLSLETVLGYTIQIAEGLSKAHQAGIIHRDVKPANILVDPEGKVRILDFGLAKLGGLTRLTSAASTLGTIYYMSPEQARTSDVDHRSDIFSLGVILYELVTGRLPFPGDNPAAVAHAIQHDEPHPLARYSRDASPELQRIVSKALAKDRDERYQTAADLASDLRRLLRMSTTGEAAAPVSASPRRHRARILVPASIVGAAAALFLVLKPFTLKIAPDQPVAASENTLAVLYFENMVDSGDAQRLGEIVTNLLITSLSESSSLNVLSSQRLYDILKLQGMEGRKVLDESASTGVARRAGARWMLLGNILQVEPDLVVTAQLVDVETGKVAWSRRIEGETDENVFAVADRLSEEVRGGLTVSAAVPVTRAEPGIKVSTRSPEAYRCYLEGLEHSFQYDREAAQKSFQEALRYDSTFAMAYFEIANLEPEGETLEYIKMAKRYESSVTRHEQLLIDARYEREVRNLDRSIALLTMVTELYPKDKMAYYTLGLIHKYDMRDLPAAIRSWEKAIEIDPLDRLSYNQLAYAYAAAGNLDRSIWAINKYIELAPGEPNPYDSRGDLYAQNGRVDEALASYKKALEIRPDYDTSRLKLGFMFRAKGDYRAEESTYRDVLRDAASPRSRSQARYHLAGLVAYQGNFALSLQRFDQGIAADSLEKFTGNWDHYDKFVLRGEIYELLGEFDRAIQAVAGLPRLESGGDEAIVDDVVCRWAALSGDFERAERILGLLEKSQNPDAYRFARGSVAFARGAYGQAVSDFEWLMSRNVSPKIWDHFFLARAYQEASRLSEAVEEFEAILGRYDDSWAEDPIYAVTMHYYAARAYESSGWTDKAVEHYATFLKLWRGADPRIDLIDDAEQRLERLRQGS